MKEEDFAEEATRGVGGVAVFARSGSLRSIMVSP